MLKPNTSEKLAVGAAIAFFVLSLVFTLNRYYSFYASFDQGIFNQVFWNSLHGQFFQSSLSSTLSTNVVHHNEAPTVFYHRLGQHFTPALLLWLPLYALFPSPATLVVLQVTFVTAAGLVLYALARQYLKESLSALITCSFYGANAVIGPTFSNFHDLSQIPLFVFGLLLAMEKRWWWLFWLLAILTLAVREDAGVVLFGVGFYLIGSRRYPQVGLIVCAFSLAYMLILTNLVMPLFSQDISQRFMIERFGHYVEGQKEASTLTIILAIASRPWHLIQQLFLFQFWGKIKYLIGQWLPLAFVPAVSPVAWMLAGFPLLEIFLEQGESHLAINIRYALTVVPGLFFGAILWWAQHPQATKPSRRFWAICLSLSLFFSFTSSSSSLNRSFYFLLPDSFRPWVYISLTKQWQHVSQFQPLLAQIPPTASVSATTYLIPQLSSRREIIRWPALQLQNEARLVVNVDYCIADLWQLQQYQAAFKDERQLLRQSVSFIEQLANSRQYGITDFKDGVILLQKAVPSNPKAMSAWLLFRKQFV